MRSAFLPGTAVVGLVLCLALPSAGCGGGGGAAASCGPGTVLQGDQCVPAEGPGGSGGGSTSSSGGGGGGSTSSGGAGGAPACEDGAQQACYGGPEGTLDVGACHAGTQSCEDGAWGPCIGAVMPELETCDGIDGDCNGVVDDGLGSLSCGIGQCAQTKPACVDGKVQTCKPGTPGPEACDGLDNDCDGEVDEGSPGAGEACDTGLLGVCAGGTTACVDGVLTCDPTAAPSPESCNGLDDDCDGTADEDSAGAGQDCNTGNPGVCAAGTTVCKNGALSCSQTTASSPESCNGLDDDCDGTADEDGAGAGQDCNTGKLGVCAAGTTVCENGALSCSQTTASSPESCNGLDDDCDGTADEDSAGAGEACGTGKLGVCAVGKTGCVNGALSCSQTTASSPESCNGLDDDCDGTIDENSPGTNLNCSTGKLGVCAAGKTACVNGSLTCSQTTASSPDVCDGWDNDCDGVADEGNPGGGQACTTGMPGPCAAGTISCVSGSLVCQAVQPPAPEQCNGIDDDCDGLVDDSVNGAAIACGTGLPGPCASGSMECAGGQLTCTQQVLPSTEVCDGWDNDCDGTADEGCPTTCDPVGLAAGKMTVGPSSGLVALCGGEVLVGNTLLNRVERHDVVTKTLVASYPLGAAPGDIAHDASANVAYVTLSFQSQIARIDLASGAVVTIPVAAPASRLALGDDGLVFASHTSATLSLVDGPAATLLAAYSLPAGLAGDLVAFDRPSEHLFLGKDGGTTLSRFHFDAATLTLTALQAGSAALNNCRALVTSPAGGHVAYVCATGNGPVVTNEIYDYSPYDLSVVSGSWPLGVSPGAAVFAADGTRFFASSGLTMKLFDATTHTPLQTIQELLANVCSYANFRRAALSPGGTIAYGSWACGQSASSGEIHWYIL